MNRLSAEADTPDDSETALRKIIEFLIAHGCSEPGVSRIFCVKYRNNDYEGQL